MKKLIYPLTAIICAAILGGSLIRVQDTKQEMKQAEIDNEKKEIIAKEIMYASCVDKAEKKYDEWMRLNGTEQENGSVLAPNWKWDIAEKNKQQAIDNCIATYRK